MFNYNHLYYFYVTAKSGGVTAGAKNLRIAQPSLSAQLRVLEGALNQRLFQKSGRRMELSADGQAAYGYCRRIFETAEEFSDFLKQSDQSKGARVRIGVTDQIERPFVADLVSVILKNKEGPKQPMISMITERHADLLRLLQNRQIDLLLSNQPAYGEDFQQIASADMPVVLVASATAFKKAKVDRGASLAQLIRALPGGLVLPSEKLRIRHETDLFLQKNRVSKPIVFESDILAAVIRAILDGVGFGFIPLPYVSREISHDSLIRLGPKQGCWQHRLILTALKKKTLDTVSSELRDAIEKLERNASQLAKA